MRARALFTMSVALSAAPFQAGCNSSHGPRQNAAGQEKAAGTRGEGSAAAVTAQRHSSLITLPEGTPVVVRTTSVMSTKTHQAGQSFIAHLEQPLVLDGREIAPKGAEAEGTIVESDPGGRMRDRATLAVTMTRLHLAGGGVAQISTGALTHEANATKAKDAAKIGIGSGVGAAIGAIAGGGKGAAIGAAAGAAAGTGVVLSTRGDPAVIPSETVLHFALRAPVTLVWSR
ncbi:MAG: hypothetical protein K6T59_10630 [Bryobacteraceae bacterium]|nr:hypothetical protein [Bryobacteraceae bacterium]